jgi:hypothetical protein
VTYDDLTPEQGYRNEDLDTSKRAFKEQDPTRLSDRMKMILSYMRERGEKGTTDFDIRMRFGPDNPESSWRKRRSDLKKKGLVVDSGRRTVKDGSSVIVWVVAEVLPAQTSFAQTGQEQDRGLDHGTGA